jgi:hypothetical protein
VTLRPFDELRARDERERFAKSALRLAGLVPRALGWRPGEFWNATPAELATILADAGEPGGEPLGRAEMTALMEHDGHGRR